MIVIPQKWFQLGNRLFAMGHFIATAVEHGFRVANPAFEDYADHFETTRQDVLCRFPPRRCRANWLRPVFRALDWPATWVSRNLLHWHLNTRLLRAVAVGIFDEYRLDCPQFLGWASRTWLLMCHGWSFRNPEAFNRQAGVIREYFRPRADLLERVERTINSARADCDVLVGVHIRHGDYKTHLGGKYFYETPRYVEFMKQMVALLPERRVGFLVCSNAEQVPALFARLNCHKPDGHLVVDMYSLARCDYILGPPSTFSQWASFYGQVPLCILREAEQPVTLEGFRVFDATQKHS
jgi:hypothetical protein